MSQRVRQRNNILKCLAGTSWGKDKETLTVTYKAIGRSLLNYAAPIWTPQISNTNWQKLQVAQNSALRTITGCHLMSHQDHLHRETSILPVKPHNELLASQYLLQCHATTHPCNVLLHRPTPPRHIRGNLVTKFLEHVSNYIPPDGLDALTYKIGLRGIHTDFVERAIGEYTVNRVLDDVPPDINGAEIDLPRSTRCTLAQLRSGWCRLLNSYMSRIDGVTSNSCPKCNTGPHDVKHLFQCPAAPTNLDVTTLWTDPTEAARFLDLRTAEEVDERC
ncbi:hypothetical protein M8J77_001059 [Diaphorina citri]|nr:hypothetical protein M8J77_001059 [Diaphorina citri]